MSVEENQTQHQDIGQSGATWAIRILILVVSVAVITGLLLAWFAKPDSYLAAEIAGLMALAFGVLIISSVVSIVEASYVREGPGENKSAHNPRLSNAFVLAVVGLVVALFSMAVFMVTGERPVVADLWGFIFGVATGVIVSRPKDQELHIREGPCNDIINVLGSALRSRHVRAALLVLAAAWLLSNNQAMSVAGFIGVPLTLSLVLAYDRISEPNKDG